MIQKLVKELSGALFSRCVSSVFRESQFYTFSVYFFLPNRLAHTLKN